MRNEIIRPGRPRIIPRGHGRAGADAVRSPRRGSYLSLEPRVLFAGYRYIGCREGVEIFLPPRRRRSSVVRVRFEGVAGGFHPTEPLARVRGPGNGASSRRGRPARKEAAADQCGRDARVPRTPCPRTFARGVPGENPTAHMPLPHGRMDSPPEIRAAVPGMTRRFAAMWTVRGLRPGPSASRPSIGPATTRHLGSRRLNRRTQPIVRTGSRTGGRGCRTSWNSA